VTGVSAKINFGEERCDICDVIVDGKQMSTKEQ
jgi:hypothetical protein